MKKYIILIAILFFNNPVYSDNSSIMGIVVDKMTQNPLFAANVVLLNNQMDVLTGVITSEDGSFKLENISPGSYNLRISRIGHKTIIKNRLIVRSGRPTYLNIEMEEQLLHMEGLTVRPSFFTTTSGAVVSSRSMDYEEISSQPGGNYDIQRAIEALPAVISAADQNNEIIVRGGNYGENLFILDNIEIPNPNHFGWQGTSGGPISVINTDFVRHIDFIAGAFPAKYGDKASSVLDVQMREGLRDNFHAKISIGMSGAGGSIEGPIGRGSYMISAHKSYLSLIADSWGMTAIPTYYNVQGKLIYNITKNHKLSVLGLYANDKIYFSDEEDANLLTSSEVSTIDYQASQYTVGATLKSLLGNGYSLFTISRTINYWNRLLEDTLGQEYYRNNAIESSNTVKLDLNIIPFKNNNLSFGLYLSNPEHEYDIWLKPDTLFIYDSISGQIIDTTDYIYSIDTKGFESTLKYGGYIHLGTNLGRFVSLSMGLRYDKFDYTEHDYISPRAGLSFHLGNRTDFNLAYGRHYQSPQWFELVLDPANHYLKSKFTDQYVVGLSYLFSEDIKGTIEAYHKEYRDVPIQKAYTTADPNDWNNIYVNEGEGYAKGIEFFLQKKVKTNFWGTMSYSYSIARMYDPRDKEIEYSWDFDYGHVFTLITGYRNEYRGNPWYDNLRNNWWYGFIAWLPFMPSDESEYTIKFRYLGGKPYTEQSWHPEWKKWTLDETQPINASRVDAYSRIDILLSQRWFFRKWNLQTYVHIENILNTPNVWQYNYNDDGSIETIYQVGRMMVLGFILEL